MSNEIPKELKYGHVLEPFIQIVEDLPPESDEKKLCSLALMELRRRFTIRDMQLIEAIGYTVANINVIVLSLTNEMNGGPMLEEVRITKTLYCKQLMEIKTRMEKLTLVLTQLARET